ncbi:hypothetical protein BHE74_00041218 [Ensete ventricosum]|nr:hypothetical protein BHE74_00041218 [Ensete ventricosum]
MNSVCWYGPKEEQQRTRQRKRRSGGRVVPEVAEEAVIVVAMQLSDRGYRYADRPLPGGSIKNRLSAVNFDRRRLIEEEIDRRRSIEREIDHRRSIEKEKGKKKRIRKKKEEGKKEYLARQPSPPAGRLRAVTACGSPARVAARGHDRFFSRARRRSISPREETDRGDHTGTWYTKVSNCTEHTGPLSDGYMPSILSGMWQAALAVGCRASYARCESQGVVRKVSTREREGGLATGISSLLCDKAPYLAVVLACALLASCRILWVARAPSPPAGRP